MDRQLGVTIFKVVKEQQAKIIIVSLDITWVGLIFKQVPKLPVLSSR